MTIQDGLFRSLAEKQEELLKTDKAAVGSNKHGPQDDDADAPLDAAVVAQATVVAAENEADEATPGKKGKKKKKTTEKDEAKEKDESAPIGRIFKMQSDQALSLLLMGLGSAFACAVSVWSFYQLVVVFEFPYLTRMRHDAQPRAVQVGGAHWPCTPRSWSAPLCSPASSTASPARR